MTKFIEIPRKKFPLNDDKYNELMDQIRNAARGFSRIGTADSRLVEKNLMEVWERLHRTWNLVQEIERREKCALNKKV